MRNILHLNSIQSSTSLVFKTIIYISGCTPPETIWMQCATTELNTLKPRKNGRVKLSLSNTGWAEPSFLSSLLHIPNAPYMEHLYIHIYRILKPNARKYSIWALGYETMHLASSYKLRSDSRSGQVFYASPTYMWPWYNSWGFLLLSFQEKSSVWSASRAKRPNMGPCLQKSCRHRSFVGVPIHFDKYESNRGSFQEKNKWNSPW